MTGSPGLYQVQVSGADKKHDVRGVAFEDVVILGENVAIFDSKRLQVGDHVDWNPANPATR